MGNSPPNEKVSGDEWRGERRGRAIKDGHTGSNMGTKIGGLIMGTPRACVWKEGGNMWGTKIRRQ